VSIYVSRKLQREIKQLALTYDCKPQDHLYVEAINLFLRMPGRLSVAELKDE
jgi:hypothetical protein